MNGIRIKLARLEKELNVMLAQEIERTYLAHCIGCRETDGLVLFAHRIEGQMVGWVFTCSDCKPKMSQLQLKI